ncbi:MAG: tripartite tricarboxylate transporter substrate binding protein [Deltaproteobacteria bacterium]|nr:tripartite tricarboxylate transporter substrate binding protein [Deltaproteobacteria bacterium]
MKKFYCKRLTYLFFPLILLWGTFFWGGYALAGEYPEKPVKLIVPWKAGGDTDVLMRVIAHYASKYLGHPMVVVNVGGVGGTLGARQGKDAKPDGYTLTATHESVITSQLVGVADFNYSQFIPIANMVATPGIVAARPTAPWNNIKEMIEDAKKRPGQITFGATLGSTSHFVPLEIAYKAGIEFKIVGYEGTADRQTALLGGFIDLGESNPASGKKYFEAKKLKALGIAQAKRHPMVPEMPTLRELGLDVIIEVNRGICAPLNTPQPIVNKLVSVLKKASEDPEFVKKIEDLGTAVNFLPTDQYKAHIKKETQRYSLLAKKFGVEGLKKKK